MGSVRRVRAPVDGARAGRRRIVRTTRVLGAVWLLAGLPGAAFAQSCADQRPGWTPGTEVSALAEAIALFSSPVALILLIATVLCFRFRHQWGALVVVVCWTGVVSLIAFTGAGGRAAGMAEGCIGSPTLFIAIVAALSVGLILYTAPRPDKGPP